MGWPPELALGLVFLAGSVSFLSPCVLPLLPAYLAYSAGTSVRNPAVGTMTSSALCFVAGFSTLFVAMGLAAASAGSALLALKLDLELPAGILLIVFGLAFAFPALYRNREWRPLLARFIPAPSTSAPARLGMAFLLGLAFGFGWTPCIGPILGTVLTYAARSGNMLEGGFLLSVYAAGLGLPFIVAAAGMAKLASRPGALLARHWRSVELTAGGLLMLTGLLMASGLLRQGGFALLNLFPRLGELG